MRYIGVDVGSKKTGLAYSDKENNFAYPIGVFNSKDIFEEIKKQGEKYETNQVILGESIAFSGEKNEIMTEIEDLKKKLEENGFLINFEPEYFSTKEAQRHGGNDANAAAIILQSFLDKTNNQNK